MGIRVENVFPTIRDRKSEKGFIGFFDILGYGSFLESGITEVTLKVLDILSDLPRRMISETNDFFGNVPDEDIQWELDRIIPLVVSDSILLRSSYDEDRDPAKRTAQAATFLVTACVFQRIMFEEGLPVRGAIAFGEFIFVDHAFAGKPIIDAYKLGHSLNLAACVLHETTENEFKALIVAAPEFKGFLGEGLQLVRYRTPVKDVTKKLNLLCLNLVWPTLKGYTPLKERTSLRRYVLEQFSAYNKQVGPNEDSKIENTEEFLQLLYDRFPYLFYRDP